MSARQLLASARLFSGIFRPVYYPMVGLIILLTFSYLSLLPWALKIGILGAVYLTTVLLPQTCVYVYRRVAKVDLQQMETRRNRSITYYIYVMCYLLCTHLLSIFSMPTCISAIIMVSLLVQSACLIINIVWKVSMHAAGSGAVIGAIFAYAHIFAFNPLWWGCAAILLSGLVMTCRLILRRHSLIEVLCGTFVGVVCAYVGILHNW